MVMTQGDAVLRSSYWQSGPSQELSPWNQLGIKHGFCGKGHEAPDKSKLWQVTQVHGPRIVPLDMEQGSEAFSKTEADGIYAEVLRHGGQTIGIKTADCLPILIYSPKLVMALHGGWRGLSQGIIDQAIDILRSKGVELGSSTFKVGLGPAIGPGHFEVGEEVIEAFKQSPASAALSRESLHLCITKGAGDRWHFDLAAFTVLQFAGHGVPAKQISVLRHCTFQNPDPWPSYRRDGAGAGRIMSFISCATQPLSEQST